MVEDMELPGDIKRLETIKAEWEECNHFFESFRAAEFHWFFVQGLQAIRSSLYLPGVSSLLNGIEASLRITIAQVSSGQQDVRELSPYRVLSNKLIRDAAEFGMPVDLLAFPGERDFLEKLASKKPNRLDVEIVRLRNDICHGNILQFVNDDLGFEHAFLVPECLRDLSDSLLSISHAWADGLASFKQRV